MYALSGLGDLSVPKIYGSYTDNKGGQGFISQSGITLSYQRNGKSEPNVTITGPKSVRVESGDTTGTISGNTIVWSNGIVWSFPYNIEETLSPTPTPTPAPAPTIPISEPIAPIWAGFQSTVPVVSPPVTTTTQVEIPAIDNKWLYIGGGLLAIVLLSGRSRRVYHHD